MSIVEKAVGRARADGSRVPPAGSRVPAPAVPLDVREGQHGLVADVPPIPVRQFLMLDQHPGLSRDFRFLKRPVLARVFGLSRSAQKAGNLVMITSDLPQVGKSFVSLHLAASIAQEQMTNIVLIDADPVRRTLTSRMGLDDRPGLMEALGEPEKTRLADLVLPTDIPSLRFLPAGQPRPDATELLASARMPELLRAFNDPNLVVLLDSPPLLLTSEARVLAEHVHHSIVVVEAGRSSSADLTNILHLLQASPASVSLVLNKTPGIGASRYSDYYQY